MSYGQYFSNIMVVHEQCFRCTLYLQIIKQNLKLFLFLFFFTCLCNFISNKGERLNVEAFLFPRLNIKKNKQAKKMSITDLILKKNPMPFPSHPYAPNTGAFFFKSCLWLTFVFICLFRKRKKIRKREIILHFV